MAENSDSSLRSLLEDAQRSESALENYPSSASSGYQITLQSCIATYEKCQKLVDSLSMFSLNETFDDVATVDIRYLSLDHLLAEVYSKLSTSSPGEREKLLKRCNVLHARFLTFCDSYELLSASDKRQWEARLEAEAGGEDASQNYLRGGGDLNEAARKRNEKIQRFREEKELQAKLEMLRQRNVGLNVDESTVRELYKTELSLQMRQSLSSLDSIALELSLLANRPPAPPPQPQEPADGSNGQKDAYSDKLDMQLPGLRQSGPLLSSSGKPLRPFTLTGKRRELQQGVFRSGHNLPTMSIDEYLEEERRRGGIIEGGGEESGKKREIDEDNHDEMDRETLKAREWDEFKEAHPKGSGNTLNRG